MQESGTAADMDEAYKIALTLEKDTLKLLNELKSHVTEDQVANVDRVIEEEKTHIKFLEDNR